MCLQPDIVPIGKFAAGVIDTGGNLQPASLTPAANLPPVLLTSVANLPPVSTTQGELVAKFAAGIIDTGGAPWLASIPANFRKKFEMILMLLSGAWGKVIHEKYLKQKISWHCPFKGTVALDGSFAHSILSI
jgi:hypothetical protein